MFTIKPDFRPSEVLRDIKKQLRYGTAIGLTKSAQEGQTAVIGAMKKEFILRTNWWEKNRKYGIKIQPAKPQNLESQIRTAAPWLEIHAEGGQKKPISRKALTVPTELVRPPRSPIKIPKRHRQKLKQQGSFILKLGPSAAFLAVRKHFKSKKRKSVLQLFYLLSKTVKIEKRPFWKEPIEKGLERRLAKNIAEGIQTAFRTRKP